MKKFLESSSSEEEEVGQGVFRAKRKRESSTSEDEDVKHDLFKKVDVDLKNHVYEPVHFVRAHCKVGEKPEVETQVWDADVERGGKGRLATCGGAFLCVFATKSNQLLMRYSLPKPEMVFYSLAWMEVEGKSYLAACSGGGEVRLFHPTKRVCFATWRGDGSREVDMYAVEAHRSAPSWLFTATSDSVVTLWDIGRPSPPSYKGIPRKLLRVAAEMTPDLYSMAWVKEQQWLFAGTAGGLIGWHLPIKVLTGSVPAKPSMIDFELVPDSETREYGQVVDSVCSLGKGLVAAKCVNYGKILVFKAEFPALQEKNRTGNLCNVEVLAEFAWRHTMEHFINIGGSADLKLMACGDDQGTIWLYSLPAHLLEASSSNSNLPSKLLPIGRLPWPKLQVDGELQEGTNVMIDKVVFSPEGNHIIAITNNNIVAFWKRSQAST